MSKTPVSILHELMQRKQIVPEYEPLPSEGFGTHNPTFYFRVTAGEVSKIGKARSKKDAKHEAAKLALEALKEMGIYHPEHVSTTPSSPVASASSAAAQGVQLNAVGILKEFCADNNIPEPQFDLISDVGPAHCRLFTVECKIGNMPGISAEDLTKKKAKQAAAQLMLNRLQKSLPDIVEQYKDLCYSNATVVPQKIIDGYNENTMQKKKVNWGLKVSNYPKTIKNIMNEKNLTYDVIWNDVINEDVGSLQDILNKLELNYKIDFEIFDDKKIAAFIAINSDPDFVFVETGESKEAAVGSVLKPTFQFLKIMTK